RHGAGRGCMNDEFQELDTRLREVNDIESASSVLRWDQATLMPRGGAEARGRQLATLDKLAHAKITEPRGGELLGNLAKREASLAPDSFEASLIRVARRDYDRATRLPPDFVTELAAHTAESYDVWTRARPANDFSAVRPYLEKTVELSRRYAAFF